VASVAVPAPIVIDREACAQMLLCGVDIAAQVYRGNPLRDISLSDLFDAITTDRFRPRARKVGEQMWPTDPASAAAKNVVTVRCLGAVSAGSCGFLSKSFHLHARYYPENDFHGAGFYGGALWSLVAIEAYIAALMGDIGVGPKVYDVFGGGASTTFVMERVRAPTLFDYVEKRPFSLRLLQTIFAATARMHAHHVHHGDLHPGNVLVIDEDNVRVIDYGRSALYERYDKRWTAADYARILDAFNRKQANTKRMYTYERGDALIAEFEGKNARVPSADERRRETDAFDRGWAAARIAAGLPPAPPPAATPAAPAAD
jgi:tRNA A-37 threonylcarbamoyl transferase component Bud32